jgi:hypothetical protein
MGLLCLAGVLLAGNGFWGVAKASAAPPRQVGQPSPLRFNTSPAPQCDHRAFINILLLALKPRGRRSRPQVRTLRLNGKTLQAQAAQIKPPSKASLSKCGLQA